jgi:hypothetical protein
MNGEHRADRCSTRLDRVELIRVRGCSTLSDQVAKISCSNATAGVSHVVTFMVKDSNSSSSSARRIHGSCWPSVRDFSNILRSFRGSRVAWVTMHI